MSFAFATCDRSNALKFLRKLYPSTELHDTANSAGDLLDIIAADEVRVCDPDFHGGQMIQGNNWKDDTLVRATAALKKAGVVFCTA
jgi:hypothetical protein